MLLVAFLMVIGMAFCLGAIVGIECATKKAIDIYNEIQGEKDERTL